VSRPSRYNEIVVAQSALSDDYLVAAGVDACDSPEHDARIALSGEKAAHRPSDIRGRQPSSRNLIKQRLKQVVIASIYQSDLDWGIFQALGSLKPAKSRADDDNTWPLCRLLINRLGPPHHDAFAPQQLTCADLFVIGLSLLFLSTNHR
jgi:hypothetical protein